MNGSERSLQRYGMSFAQPPAINAARLDRNSGVI